MQTFFWITGGFCLLYYLVIVLYAGITSDISWIWAVLGGLLLLTGALIDKGIIQSVWHHIPMPVRVLAGCAAAVVIIVCAALLSRILSGMSSQPQENLTYVVVLGGQVREDRPSRSLKARLDKAVEIAEMQPQVQLILSGGQGPDEPISEAECMFRYLTQSSSIAPERLIMEDQSTSTLENLIFSDRITGCSNAKTGIVSNDFHIYRAVAIAKKLGYTDCCGIPSASDPVMQLHFMVREVLALANEIRRGSV